MMMRLTFIALLSLLAYTTATFAQGAVPSPPSSAFNWLNLNRQGNSAAANYYQLVRPSFQTQNALMNMQQQYTNLSQSVTSSSTDASSTMIRETGHAATFMNYGRYYPRLGGSSSAGRPGQGPVGNPPRR